MRRSSRVLFTAASALLLLSAAPAHAAFPGQNGKIAFERSTEIFTVNPDGSGEAQLTPSGNGPFDGDPAWSPDGRKIAFASLREDTPDCNVTPPFSCNFEIYVMNADGSNQTRITNNDFPDLEPAWSPDGSKIAFRRCDNSSPYYCQIHLMNADGSGQVSLTTAGNSPQWSPDGAKIAFNGAPPSTFGYEIWSMNADGSDSTRISPFRSAWPNWAPDASRIAFVAVHSDGISDEDYGHIWTMNPDGSGPSQLTTGGTGCGEPDDRDPAWSPNGAKIVFDRTDAPPCGATPHFLYVMNADGTVPSPLGVEGANPDWQPILHDAPASADTLHMSLVPMFRQTISTSQCAARGGQASTHGAPLAFSSCNPPGYLPNTMARLGPSSQSSVRVMVVPGDPATAADEAELHFSVSATDVRALPGGGDYDPSAGADITLNLLVRLTDTYNGLTLHTPATTVDFPSPMPVNCAPTADPSIGSTCAATVTAGAYVPDTILEAKRTVMTLNRFWLYDIGANGTWGDSDDRQFAQQGIYIP